jgi:hypothetical protein
MQKGGQMSDSYLEANEEVPTAAKAPPLAYPAKIADGIRSVAAAL